MANEERYLGLVKPDPLYCPRCGALLILGEGTKRYETLVEHVQSNGYREPPPKEYYICSNNLCLTKKFDCFWDWYGTFYGWGDHDKNNEMFMLDFSAALNSGQRNFDLSYKKKSIPILHLIWFRLILEKYCVPDKPGLSIIKYKYKIIAVIKSRGSWVHYTPGIKMFFFCINRFKHARDRFMEDTKSTWTYHQMLEELRVHSHDKRWWKLLSVWWLNTKYPGLKERLENLEKNRA